MAIQRFPARAPVRMPGKSSFNPKAPKSSSAAWISILSLNLNWPLDSILRPVEPLSPDEIRKAVQLALAEDIGGGDATTLATVPAEVSARALMRGREPLVL